MPDFSTIAGIISDLDGVAYRGEAPIASAVEAFRAWRERGLPYAFVTNNSTRSAEAFAAKLRGLDIAAEARDVITSAEATAEVLKQRYPPGTAVFVIGAEALRRAIRDAGFLLAEREAGVVVAGLDRSFSYAKLETAQRIILSGGAFYGTNPDRMLPSAEGFEPGAGSLLAAIEACSGRAPTVIGKPQPTLVELALERLGTPRDRTLVIGDQLATDIAAGKSAELPTLLVKTGVPEAGPRSLEPDFEVAHLGEVRDLIRPQAAAR